jgi:hypothetical protein
MLPENRISHFKTAKALERLTTSLVSVENSSSMAVEGDGIKSPHSPAPKGSFETTLIDMLAYQPKKRLSWRDMTLAVRPGASFPLGCGGEAV